MTVATAFPPSTSRRLAVPVIRILLWPGLLWSLLLLLALRTGATARAEAADAGVAVAEDVSVADQLGVGAWIWTTNAADKQTCRLWRSFEVPGEAALARAILRITADNGYRVFFDGREIGRGGDWKYLTEYDLTSLMSPGLHVLAVEAFNDALDAGVILGLRLEFADGGRMELNSDPSWRVAPADDRHWQARKYPDPAWLRARIVGFTGQQPWWQRPNRIIYAPPSLPVILNFWQQSWFLASLLALCLAVLALCVRQTAQLTVQTRTRRMLERERARIARDIHDDLGARLTQLVLLGEVARSELPAASEARAQIDQVCDKARDLSHAMDEIIWAVNSRRDTLRDFASYVCKYAQLFLASTSIRCRLDVEPDIPAVAFDLPVRRNLFLAIKEAVTNAAKHSDARELYVRIHRQRHELRVVVEDNGRGFDLAEANLDRHGMTNMEQRMQEAGGRCRVLSEPGKGCRVEFTVPLSRAARFSRWFKWRQDSPAAEAPHLENPAMDSAHAPDSAQS